VACVFLFLSLTRQLRKVNVRQAQVDAEAGDGAPDEPRARDDRPDAR
jgi:hypothetical protein